MQDSNLPVRVAQGSASIARHSAIFVWGDGDHWFLRLPAHEFWMRWSHTPSITRRAAWVCCDHEDWIYQRQSRTEGRSFLAEDSLRLQPRRWCVGFSSPPLLLWELKARSWPLQRPQSQSAENQTTDPSTENTNTRQDLRCSHTMRYLGVKNRVHLASYLHNKHVSFKCLIWYSH